MLVVHPRTPDGRAADAHTVLSSRAHNLALQLGLQIAVGAAYYGAAQTGFAFAFETKQVTAIWPPTGLAFAALVLGGVRLWPGVIVGAFISNITSSEPFLTALGVAAGNTLEAVVGALLFVRVFKCRASLNGMRDVVVLALTAFVSTLFSATIGVGSLASGDLVPWDKFGSVWRVWWLGDVGGDLLVAPVVLVLGSLLLVRSPGRARLAASSLPPLVVLVVAGAVVLHTTEPVAYLLFPLVFAVAVRFRQLGATLGSLALACVAVWMTKAHHGPFSQGAPDAQMLRAQMFVGVLGLTAMLAAAIRTERLAADEQIAIVERKVAERTQELLAANRELEAFSYSVSHDLRAPLRAIDGYSKALIEDYETSLDDNGVSMLQRVRANSQRMAELIDELLTLSRLTRKPMTRVRVDLSELATAIVDELRRSDPARSVDVRIEPGMVVDGDRELLRTALQNLIDNAWKFTSRTEHPVIEFGRQGNTAGHFFVHDNGAGFDMKHSDKLFRPFERLHAQREFTGNGVGLTTVQRVLRRHGGDVWAEAERGAGATFYFTVSSEES